MTLPATTVQRQRAEAEALCKVIHGIHLRGWCDGTGGNFSTVLCEDPLNVLMAPSGVDKGSLQPDDLILVDGAGQVMSGRGKASAETLLHLTIITNAKARAVLHTHSQAATLLSRLTPIKGGATPQPSTQETTQADCKGASEQSAGIAMATQSPVATSQATSYGTKSLLAEVQDGCTEPSLLGYLCLDDLEMLKGIEGVRSHTTSITLPIISNCQDMRKLSLAAQPSLANAPYGLLIAGHGLYAWGDSLQQARRHLEVLEFLLEQEWRHRLLNAVMRKEGTPQ